MSTCKFAAKTRHRSLATPNLSIGELVDMMVLKIIRSKILQRRMGHVQVIGALVLANEVSYQENIIGFILQ